MEFNEKVVEFLKQEEEKLRTSMENCLQKGDYSMYKNLINAYERIVELIRKYDWKLMYSEYETDSKEFKNYTEKQIAIWEQNGDGVVRNHKVWTYNWLEK